MLIEHLTIDQASAALRKFLAENQQRGFRGVHRAREHRLAAKQRPCATPYMPPTSMPSSQTSMECA
jgi:hypothetical protein